MVSPIPYVPELSCQMIPNSESFLGTMANFYLGVYNGATNFQTTPEFNICNQNTFPLDIQVVGFAFMVTGNYHYFEIFMMVLFGWLFICFGFYFCLFRERV